VTSIFTAFLVKSLAVSGIAIHFPKSRQSELIRTEDWNNMNDKDPQDQNSRHESAIF
jgi:hypothetical protein